MDKETKVLFVTLGVAFIILLITKPKGFMAFDFSKNKYSAPKEANPDDQKLKDNAKIAMQAMKDAIAKKESKQQLDKLNALIQKDYGLKIVANRSTGKLRALSTKTGGVIAEEA